MAGSQYVGCVADAVGVELGRPVLVEGRTVVFPAHHHGVLHPFTRLVAPGAGSSAVAAARLRVKLLEKAGEPVPRGVAELAAQGSAADHVPGDNCGEWRWGTGQPLVDEVGVLVTGRSPAAVVAAAGVWWWGHDVVDRGWVVTSRGDALWVNPGDDDAPRDLVEAVDAGGDVVVDGVVAMSSLWGVAAGLRVFAGVLERRALAIGI